MPSRMSFALLAALLIPAPAAPLFNALRYRIVAALSYSGCGDIKDGGLTLLDGTLMRLVPPSIFNACPHL